jgi:hypothetical protein
MDRRGQGLERAIERVKRELCALGELRPGSLSQQYNVCGVKGCHCKAFPPQKHGPYYQISFTRKRKSSSRFVRREELALVKQQLKNYQRLKQLVDEWIDLGTELSNLHLEEKRERARG